MEMLFKLSDKELYPLVEVAKIEEKNVQSLLYTMLNQYLKNEIINLYLKGKISLWKAAEIMGISLWDMITLMEKNKVPLQIAKLQS